MQPHCSQWRILHGAPRSHTTHSFVPKNINQFWDANNKFKNSISSILAMLYAIKGFYKHAIFSFRPTFGYVNHKIAPVPVILTGSLPLDLWPSTNMKIRCWNPLYAPCSPLFIYWWYNGALQTAQTWCTCALLGGGRALPCTSFTTKHSIIHV